MKIQVLDHGYVEFVEAWGNGKEGQNIDTHKDEIINDYEVGIIEAARQSTQGSFRGWEAAPCDCHQHIDLLIGPNAHTADCASKKHPGDARLLAYLYNNQHNTPFEFAGMVIEVQAPIFVFREWHRHRTQSYNEMSARYAPLPDLNYIPSMERLLSGVHGSNKQAGSKDGTLLTESDAAAFQSMLRQQYHSDEMLYQAALAQGVAKELARLVLPVGRYSKMRASANLRNWLAFLTLRCDLRAQWEIQQYAHAVAKIVEAKFPQTYKLWVEQMAIEWGG